MNHQLHPGLHVAIVTNPRGGNGGSLFAWETYIACKLSGIAAILATFDQQRAYPEIGTDLRRLPVPDAHTYGQSGPENIGCLLPLVHEAQSFGKFLIIDTMSGFTLTDPMFDVLEYCRIPEATSIAALLPIGQNIPISNVAETQCSDFREIGISFTRGLFRSWAVGAGSTSDSNHPLAYPVWRPAELSKKTLAIINDEHSFLECDSNLHVPDLFGCLSNQNGTRREKGARLEARSHLPAAKTAIFNALLAPISH